MSSSTGACALDRRAAGRSGSRAGERAADALALTVNSMVLGWTNLTFDDDLLGEWRVVGDLETAAV